MIKAVAIPDTNIPAMKRNAAGPRATPPDIASPLVQPPAIPAPYSSTIAPENASPHRTQRLSPKTFAHCTSGIQLQCSFPALSAPTIPPTQTPTSRITCPVIPGGMTKLEYTMLEAGG